MPNQWYHTHPQLRGSPNKPDYPPTLVVNLRHLDGLPRSTGTPFRRVNTFELLVARESVFRKTDTKWRFIKISSGIELSIGALAQYP